MGCAQPLKPSDTVLVTGASGFIGRHVTRRLKTGGTDLISIDHRWSSIQDVAAEVGRRKVDWCVHLGWYANPQDYLTNAGANVKSLTDSIELMTFLAQIGCGHVVVAGTSAEYAQSEQPLTEDADIDPWSVYGASKSSLRLILRSSLRPGSMTVTWARIFNVTGPGEAPQRLIPRVIRAAQTRQPLELTNGLQRRDYLDVEDLADALVTVGQRRMKGDVNLCSGKALELRSFLLQIADLAGSADALEFGALDRGQNDFACVVGDAARLRVDAGWQQKIPIDHTIERLVRYWSTYLSKEQDK